ncbi:MAG TPA: transglutaminase-like cysteine peptidase [Stellaceae bacterium]|nr:transglutaminase-like cysteine peptidase [Stellaceae bacterium]
MSRRLLSIPGILAASVLAAALPAAAATPMPTGALVAPPGGFIGFCAHYLSECSGVVADPAVVQLTPAARQQLDTVQARVNAAIQWRDDPQHVWDYPTDGQGDCNKFALEKRRELIALGWPRDALLLTTALTEHGEPHLVLVARTSDGDLVLDSRAPRVLDWARLPYRWIARQSPENPALWVDVLADHALTADAGGADRSAATR